MIDSLPLQQRLNRWGTRQKKEKRKESHLCASGSDELLLAMPALLQPARAAAKEE
jgi:hypothetical protein